jgi:hypothetical protein
MDKWNERLFDNLSRLNANERKSKAASVSAVRSIVNPNPSPNPVPIAVGCGGMAGLVTRSKAASSTEGKITERIEENKRVGYRENGTIAWTMKTRVKTTPAEDLRSMMFVE